MKQLTKRKALHGRQPVERVNRTCADDANTIPPNVPRAEDDVNLFAEGVSPTIILLGLITMVEKNPDWCFNGNELAILSGFGRTTISHINRHQDSPFSCNKCSVPRLGRWLDAHPQFKAN